MSNPLLRWMPVVALQAAAALSMGAPAHAADGAASQASGVLATTESAVKRGAKATERGLVTGAKATERGLMTAASAAERGIKVATGAVDRGASAAARGVTTAGSAVERTVKRLGVPGASASAPR